MSDVKNNESEQKYSPLMMFVVTLLFGWLGVHKFMNGKNGLGILYILTCGLFFFGWGIDSIIALCNLISSAGKSASSPSVQPAAPVAPVAPVTNQTETAAFCSNCGSPLNGRFCAKCGHDADADVKQ